MYPSKTLAVGSSLLAALTALTLAASALAASHGPTVTVRIEGQVKDPAGRDDRRAERRASSRWRTLVRRADSVAGALNSATKGSWSGTWSSSLNDWDVTTILGETDNYDTTKTYWEVFVNDVPARRASAGSRLHAREQILFAAVGANETPADPLGLDAAEQRADPQGLQRQSRLLQREGQAEAARRRDRLASQATGSRPTRSGETPKLTARAAGSDALTASRTGYVRAEATVEVKAR